MRSNSIQLLILSVCIAVAVLFTTAKLPSLNPKVEADGTIIASDIDYHLLLARYTIEMPGADIYSLSAQQEALRSYFHIDTDYAMPTGASPTAFLFWRNILRAAGDLAHAANVWRGLLLGGSIFALFYAFSVSRLAALCLAAAICSWTFGTALALGQLSPIALFCLAWLKLTALRSERSGSNFAVLPLVASSIKPTHFILALLTALEKRFGKQIAFALLISAMLSLTAFSFLSSDWPMSYLRSLSAYSTMAMDEQYRSAMSSHLMNNFAEAWRSVMSNPPPYSLLSCLVSASFVASLIFLARRRESQTSLADISILVYLLFTPHLGIYEDLLLVIPLLDANYARGRVAFITAFLLMGFLLNWTLFGSVDKLSLFVIKLAYAILVISLPKHPSYSLVPARTS
jgi:hypothetical protein